MTAYSKKPRKLNSDGLAHYIVPMIVVLGVGLVGAFWLVASHASSLKSAKIKSASYSVSSVRGTQEMSGYRCGQGNVTYIVKTVGSVSGVTVHMGPASTGALTMNPPVYLNQAGNGKWQATVERTICAKLDKKGKARYPVEGYEVVDARISNSDRVVSKKLSSKKVFVN